MTSSAATSANAGTAPQRRQSRVLSSDDMLLRAGVVVLGVLLAIAILLPLATLLAKSFQNADGAFVGPANFVRYFSTPALYASLWNSVWVAMVATAIVVPAAFVYAFALTRSRMPMRGLFAAIAQLPLFAPSLLPAIALVYVFGNQGMLKSLLMGGSIYGPIGIIMAQVLYCFPHALLILITALSLADQRLYEVADALGTTRRRVLFTITLPGVKYGLISACFVVFTLVVTDFGIAKVIGGQFNVLATDAYKQVVGQQNFQMGAVVGMVLLVPAVIAFVVDQLAQRRQVALLSARAVPYEPKSSPVRDGALSIYCLAVSALILGILGVAVWASFITYWPYNLTLSTKWYNFSEFEPNGWGPYFSSLKMAAIAAMGGTAIVFTGAYVIEKTRGFRVGRGFVQFLAMLPMAVPGLVLGLAYVFFFNALWNPLNVLYGTLLLLAINTTAHFFTTAHVTALTALKQLDAEFEAVSQSLKVPFYRTFARVTVPICLPAILDPHTRDVLDRDQRRFLHQSVSTPCLNAIAKAEGIWIEDTAGRRYMDFHGNNVHHIGYGHPRLKKAIADQMDALPFAPRRYACEPAIALADKLAAIAPGNLSKVLFTTGGSDAVEVAVKLARAATGRFKTLSFWDAFHGAGFGASALSGEALFRSGPAAPLVAGASHVAPFACYRCPYGHSVDANGQPRLDVCQTACARMIDYVLARETDVAAVIAEPARAVPYLPPPGFWKLVREACNRHGALLIFDEIPTGLGKTGRMFACSHDDVTPDILVLGKALGGGILPIAAVIADARLDVGAAWAFGHYTHEKNPVTTRAALTTIEIIEDEELVENAARVGAVALERFDGMKRRHSCIGDARGRGLLLGIDLVTDRDAKTPANDLAEAVMYAALDAGLSFKTTMGNVLTLTPPLTITEAQMLHALDIVEAAIAAQAANTA